MKSGDALRTPAVCLIHQDSWAAIFSSLDLLTGHSGHESLFTAND
jgi:hypothetical protein